MKIVYAILFLCSVAVLKNYSIRSGDCAADELLHLRSKIGTICIEIMLINAVGYTFNIALQYDTVYLKKERQPANFEMYALRSERF